MAGETVWPKASNGSHALLWTRVASLAGSISLQAALVFTSSLVSLAFAGHLGRLALSQAVLATSAFNITGSAVLYGLASGMETLCGQVHGQSTGCMHSPGHMSPPPCATPKRPKTALRSGTFRTFAVLLVSMSGKRSQTAVASLTGQSMLQACRHVQNPSTPLVPWQCRSNMPQHDCMLQAYGAGNYGALGIVLQQAMLITTLTFGCTFLVWTQLHHVLLFAGVHPPPRGPADPGPRHCVLRSHISCSK